MIIALVNNKGGVGKTTTAVNLAGGLASKARRVLLIDLDSQGSASLSLGVARDALSPSSAAPLFDSVPIRSAIRQTAVAGLDLLTGSMELANADLVLADMPGRESRLKTALAPIRSDYAFIIMDCPPSLSLLPINALVAADGFIVPVVPHYLALEGLVNLMNAVDRVREGIGTVATLLGLVLTLVDYRTRVASEIAAMIREHYKGHVFRTEVRVNVRLTEAPSFGKTIFDYAAASTGAEAYRHLAAEVLQRCHKLKN
ncbi:MAG TPA: ParA family protein [Candidatus Acidoferrales bacterium]|nr:ParA family protein [Candidatus Acidoferrales bacterium]